MEQDGDAHQEEIDELTAQLLNAQTKGWGEIAAMFEKKLKDLQPQPKPPPAEKEEAKDMKTVAADRVNVVNGHEARIEPVSASYHRNRRQRSRSRDRQSGSRC